MVKKPLEATMRGKPGKAISHFEPASAPKRRPLKVPSLVITGVLAVAVAGSSMIPGTNAYLCSSVTIGPIQFKASDNFAAAQSIVNVVTTPNTLQASVGSASPNLNSQPVASASPAPQSAKTAPVKKSPTSYYRVRKSWLDAASQLGAFTHFANARDVALKNPGYKVFNQEGQELRLN